MTEVNTQVFSWGQNAYGELGHAHVRDHAAPALVEALENKKITQICAGNEHTVVLDRDGVVLTIGYNDSGQCGVGNNQRANCFTRLELATHKHISHVYSANGCEHLICLTDDGDMFVTGFNARGQLGLGHSHNVATPTLVPFSPQRVVKVACSYHHTIVATDFGKVWGFGRNDYGQLGVDGGGDVRVPVEIPSLSGVVQSLACGQYHSLVAMESGNMYSMGKNDYGQVGVSGMDVYVRPQRVKLPEGVPGSVLQVACGYYHSVALTDTGNVVVWGRNDFGQLGIGNTTIQRIPVEVAPMRSCRVVQVACGCYHTLFLVDDASVWSCGRNNHGQLGQDTTEDLATPTLIAALQPHRVVAIASGFYHSLALVCQSPSFDIGMPGVMTPGAAMAHPARGTGLATALSKLLNSPKRSDVVFEVEGRRIFGHRCIIMARCEPLEAMLDGCMREATDDVVLMEDTTHDVFLAFLEYLYTDTVSAIFRADTDLEFAMDLLTLADRFLVQPLKRLCETAVTRRIDVDCAATMLRIADSRRAEALKIRCFEFIMKNFGKVIATPAFAEMPQPLLGDVLTAASRRGVYLRGLV